MSSTAATTASIFPSYAAMCSLLFTVSMANMMTRWTNHSTHAAPHARAVEHTLQNCVAVCELRERARAVAPRVMQA